MQQTVMTQRMCQPATAETALFIPASRTVFIKRFKSLHNCDEALPDAAVCFILPFSF